jgi:hypothetical protein
MMFRNNTRFARAITLITIMGIAGHLSARENIGSPRPKSTSGQFKTTAAGCTPAVTAVDLDINNVRARLMTGGDMWWNQGAGADAAYEIPKGSKRHSQFAASCWIGGFDKQGQLKVAAQTYRQDGNDYWPGALNGNGKITADTCALWDHMWKIDRSLVKQFIQAYKIGADTKSSDFDVINGWPAKGNTSAGYGGGGGAAKTVLYLNPNNTYAPFVDVNADGKYNPADGDYPDITGDQFIWWVFNDAGNVKQQSLTASMGIEVQTSAFAYATQDFLNNSTFCNYRVINRGPLTIDSTYIAVWDDCDLGWYLDDYIGCDTTRGLGIQYNATNNDGGSAGNPTNSYGPNPPQVGLDFFQGPKRIIHRPGLTDTTKQLGMTNFTYYNNDASIIGNPTNGTQIYYYMTGSIRDGERFSYDFLGAGNPSKGYGSGPSSNFVFWGDPSDNTQWSECSSVNNPGDRRFIFSSGPFTLIPGAVNDITFGCIWAANVGGCGQTSFKTIKNIDDGAQALFDDHFKTVEGPEAPTLFVRELDRKLVFYIVNGYGSNNYGENYGRSDGAYNDSLLYHQAVVKAHGSADSLYKFQGYRIFQLANSQVTSAEIFSPTTGEVDNTKAVEVKEFDIADGVKTIVNYVKNIAISDTTNTAQVKVNGQDNGISHSFVLSQDQFATGQDKQFVNYHNYYFVAIAYAYNNFASFDPKNSITTQDVPYLASAHGGGGVDIPVVVALPNPANGAMGTIINADYGATPAITRIEGVGNGGNIVQLDSNSEQKIVAEGSIDKAVYISGSGPVEVKVIDPVKVPAMDWVLQVNGANTASDGIVNTGSWTLTGFADGQTPVTLYSEHNLGTINEQILADYGMSVTVNQVSSPGVDQKHGNGFITSDLTFDDPAQPWLWGVKDATDSSFANWLRSGSIKHFAAVSTTNPCYFNDNTLDTNGAFAELIPNFSPAKATWGPYALAAYYFNGGHYGASTVCGFEVAAYPYAPADFKKLNDVDVVFTNDKSKWTRCAVIEEQEDPSLSEGGGARFYLRKHKGWDMNIADDGVTPIYSEDAADQGMSWFPGYAIDQGTGQRLNIVFGEDSYLSGDNGNDMLWNPTSSFSNGFNLFDNSIVFGGRHFVYVMGTKYDSDKVFVSTVGRAAPTNTFLKTAYSTMQWVGLPFLNPSLKLRSLKDGIIPGAPLPGNMYTTTRLRFRVNRPYAPFAAVDTNSAFAVPGTSVTAGHAANPYYSFSTKGLAPTKLSDTSNRNKLLSRIFAVPNPYYGYSGYENNNRFDTKVRIINLPAVATIYIYSLDGSLVRTLTKSDPNSSFIDWDIRNTAGLAVASGMYLMDVKAEGIGETVIRWFGALRPLDVTTY